MNRQANERRQRRERFDAVLRRLRIEAPHEDMRGKHSHRAARRQRQERERQGMRADYSDRAGLARCPCMDRCEPAGLAAPAVRCDLGGDAHPVCSGCGLVLGGALCVHYDFSAGGDGGNAAARTAIHTSMDTLLGMRLATSACYSPSVHFAEFMALATCTGPAIPDEAMDRIADAYAAAGSQLPQDPLALTCSDVRQLLRGSMSRDDQRRYAERWLQVIRRLCGEYWFDLHGPPLLPNTVVADMKRRFFWFYRQWSDLHHRHHRLFTRRNNVPYLCTVARGLLFQSAMHLDPPWAQQHRQWLADAPEWMRVRWRDHVLQAWRLHFFERHRWVFRWLKSASSQLHNELMTALVLERLRQTPNQVLSWVEHPCLLPERPAREWRRELQRLLARRCSVSRSRDLTPLRSSGWRSPSVGQSSSTRRSYLLPTASSARSSTGTSSCSSRSPSSTDTLLEESLRLLARSCPRSATPYNERFSVVTTAAELKQLLTEWSS